MGINKYIFYYDEAFHDRKITKSEYGLNIDADGSSDVFVGVFCGWTELNEDEISESFVLFESKYKKIFGLSEDKEFKGTTIHKNNYKYGIASFNKNAINVFEDFFDILDKDIILQIHLLSKIEFLIINVFRTIKIPNAIVEKNKITNISKEAFLYTLIKFVNTYRYNGLTESFFLKDSSNKTISELLYELKRMINIVRRSAEGAKRKKLEINALKDNAYILKKCTIHHDNRQEKYQWDYSPMFRGLNNLLKEIRIDESIVSLIIDKEERTYNAAKLVGKYSEISQADSKEFIGIRIADILSNFIGRIVLSLINDLSEAQVTNYGDLKSFDYDTKKILSREWFELTESQYNLYKKLYNILFNKNNNYWSTETGIYFDYGFVFFGLIEYISTCTTSYEEFNEISKDKIHSENFNSYCIRIFTERYATFE